MHLSEKQNLPRHPLATYLPCSYGENVPASMLIYGSILIDVTAIPHALSNVPKELAMTPLPTPLMTPPVTRMYFIAAALAATVGAEWKDDRLLFCGETVAAIDALPLDRTSSFFSRAGARLHMQR